MKVRFSKFFKRVKNTIILPEMQILPGHLAFFFVLSIIPLIAIFGIIGSYLSINEMQEILTDIIPKSVNELFLPLAKGKSLNFNLAFFLITSFVLAANGCNAMITTSNSIYKIKGDNFIKQRIKSIIMTIIMILLLIFVMLVPAFGDIIFKVLREKINNNVIDSIHLIYQVIKYPLSLLLIFFNIKLLYTLSPDKKILSKHTNYGAMFTTISWILSTEIYSYYVEHFTNYNIFYGSISNIIVLMLWIYLLSYLFVLGMALNTGKYLDVVSESK